jgi:hypothetical protein
VLALVLELVLALVLEWALVVVALEWALVVVALAAASQSLKNASSLHRLS